jgi:hypothetical protein
MFDDANRKNLRGVVTSSQIKRNWPLTANADGWEFNDLTCSSIAEIRLLALNVKTPKQVLPCFSSAIGI